MKLYWYEAERGNFGDDLNQWLWDLLLPGYRDWPKDATLFGVGTILSDPLLMHNPAPLVVGSGTGYGEVPTPEAVSRCDVRAVRGPITAKLLGLPEDIPMLDGAAMIPRVAPEIAPAEKHGETLFVPHYSTSALQIDWQGLCRKAGLRYLSPEGESKEVIRTIAGASRVITESMHGAILADAYRVPWTPVLVNDRINEMKWRDFAGALDVENISFTDVLPEARMAKKVMGALKPKPEPVPAAPESSDKPEVPSGPKGSTKPRDGLRKLLEAGGPILATMISRRLKKARESGPQYLSADAALASRQDRFQEMLDGIVRDYGGEA